MTETHPWREAPPGDYAVVGDPVAHSKSPAMHAAAYRALGLNLVYRAIHVPRGELPEALNHLRDLGYRGVNCTVPHKEAALAWATETNRGAREAGAANTLDLTTGAATNTDGYGFRRSLHRDSPARSALILGAGGSAASALLALYNVVNVGGLAVWNRNPDRARALVRDVAARLEPPSTLAPEELRGKRDPRTPEEDLARRRRRMESVRVLESPDLSGYDVIVNATPASLLNEDLGLDWSRAKPDALAYDLAYGVDDAPFLRGAREAGLATLDGRDMLAGQGVLAFMWWKILWLDPLALEFGRWQQLRKEDPAPMQSYVLLNIMRNALD